MKFKPRIEGYDVKSKYDKPEKFSNGWLNSVNFPDCSPMTKEEEE